MLSCLNRNRRIAGKSRKYEKGLPGQWPVAFFSNRFQFVFQVLSLVLWLMFLVVVHASVSSRSWRAKTIAFVRKCLVSCSRLDSLTKGVYEEKRSSIIVVVVGEKGRKREKKGEKQREKRRKTVTYDWSLCERWCRQWIIISEMDLLSFLKQWE